MPEIDFDYDDELESDSPYWEDFDADEEIPEPQDLDYWYDI